MHWRILPRDWRILFGLLITLFWFVFLGVYIQMNVGWNRFMDLPIAEMGNFLEGAFAFLAFLWLVIGLFIQQSVLAENNEELRRSNLNIEKQTQAIAATELNARQETFFKIAESTRRQLGAIIGMLFLSSQGPLGNSNYDNDQLRDIWREFAYGDFEVWSRMFLGMLANEETADPADLFFGTEIRRGHTDNFIAGFERLLVLARDCDTDNLIVDSLIISAHGLLAGRLREMHPDYDFEEFDITDSQQYLQRFMAESGE
ncbi:MAG: hypothetical protein OXI17_12665 [Gammaproteobacteria bacterium]|nr:hypothetical protein [Gammaproteobacteria bacterium]